MPSASSRAPFAAPSPTAAMAMRTLRFCLLVLFGCAAAALLRADRSAERAAPSGFRAALRAQEAAGPLTAGGVRDALVAAGRDGLAFGFALLGDAEAAVRAGAALYLGSRRSRLAVPALIKLLRDPEPGVRRAAAQALGAMATPQALPFLERAMAEGEPLVAEAALGAARDIRRAEQAPPKPQFLPR